MEKKLVQFSVYYGEPEWEVPIDLDEAREQGVFTCGHCHSLAFAIHRLTGWALVSATYGADSSPCHVAVQLPNGNIFDVNGEHTIEDFEDEWGYVRIYKTLESLRRRLWYTYRPAESRKAKPFAKMLLEEFGFVEYAKESKCKKQDELPLFAIS